MIQISHVPIPKRVDEKHRDIYIISVDTSLSNLTFRGPCIVIYSYNESQQMHYFSNLFDKVLCMFRTVPL